MAVQRWPVVPNAPQSAPSRASSRLASSSTICAFLPPISSETGLKVAAARCATSEPTSLEPVKLMARTSGCSTSGAPAPEPLPQTMLTTPGRQAGIDQRLDEVVGGERRVCRPA